MAAVVSVAQPSLSRRHAAGTDSARGLLLTVLGEFVLPAGETAWTSAFIETFGRLGVEEKATRQALMRTAEDGWLAGERVGRRTLWRLTPAAERLLVDVHDEGCHRTVEAEPPVLVGGRVDAELDVRSVVRHRNHSTFGPSTVKVS